MQYPIGGIFLCEKLRLYIRCVPAFGTGEGECAITRFGDCVRCER